MERSLVGRAFAEERDGDVVAALLLEGERGADGRSACPSAMMPLQPKLVLGVEQVHVAALAVAEAGLLAEDLGGQLVACPCRARARSGAAGACRDGVGRAEVGADADGHRLLPGRQVHLAGDRPGGDVEGRRLPLEVDLLDRLLEEADPDHLPVQLAEGLVARHVRSS